MIVTGSEGHYFAIHYTVVNQFRSEDHCYVVMFTLVLQCIIMVEIQSSTMHILYCYTHSTTCWVVYIDKESRWPN